MQLWKLNPLARLRRTGDGGTVFLPDAVTTVELDAEAFAAVALLGMPHTARDLRRQLTADRRRNFTVAEIDILLRELSAHGAVSASLPEAALRPRTGRGRKAFTCRSTTSATCAVRHATSRWSPRTPGRCRSNGSWGCSTNGRKWVFFNWRWVAARR